MKRYFKIVEIDRDEFVNETGEDLDCCQLVVPVDGTVYVAVDDEEIEFSVLIDSFPESE